MLNKPIFIHIPKTGGKSIQATLKDKITIIGHHWGASMVKEEIDYWDSVFKFSIVRNPWERMVSLYHFTIARQGNKIGDRTFNEWIMEILPFNELKLLTQHEYLTQNGEIIVDFIARFENLKEDFKKICNEVGAPEENLLHINKTKHKHYAKYYTKDSKKMIEKLFADDIELFKYDYKA